MKKVNLTSISVGKKALENIEKAVRDARDLAYSEASIQNMSKLNQLKIATSKQLNDYINKYEKHWNSFNRVFQPEKIVSQAVQEEKKNAYYDWTKQKKVDKNNKTVINFIKTLYEGEYLLNVIRQDLTNQTIDTNFYFTSNNSVKRVAKKETKYSVVLSTYGASANNYVSLAYQMNSKIRKQNEIIADEITTFSENKTFFADLDSAKTKYVDYLNSDEYDKRDKDTIYTKRWDSKDMEIIELYLQTRNNRYSNGNALEEYKKDRLRFGGGGGHKTTMLQAGDIADVQVKLFGKNREVNFARQTLVIDTCKKLYKAFNDTSPVANENLRQQLLKTFTKDGEEEDFTSDVMKIAKENINNLFKETLGNSVTFT